MYIFVSFLHKIICLVLTVIYKFIIVLRFTKNEHKIDIVPLLKGEKITDADCNGKEQAVQEDFIWGVGPEALYQLTRAEYKMEPDSIKVKDILRLFTEVYMPKRNTYHNRGDFFWTKQTEDKTPEEFWRRLIEIEKACNFNTISAEEFLISKYQTASPIKITGQNDERKNIGTDEKNRINKAKHVRKKKNERTQYRKL